jgi:hypothetical protein
MRPRACAKVLCVLCLAASGAAASAQASAASAPLPNPAELLARALTNEKKLSAEQERYDCMVADQATETDKNGNVKKIESEVKEQFFVNGIAIERTTQKNGKDLSSDELKKQDARVMKETLKYSNQATAQKETDKQNQQIEDILEAMMLANGRRRIENGRSILDYNIVPNPSFHAKNINQRFATVMQGTISVDEESGEVIDLNIKSVADLKIGGGVLADLHKGFWLHIHNHAQPDGVWLTDLAEGSGDARAALFFHPYFRFKETLNGCHLYTATATQAGPVKPVK